MNNIYYNIKNKETKWNGLLLEALYAKYHADKTDAVSKLEVLKSVRC